MSILDDVTEVVKMVRKLDRFGLVDDVLDRLLRLREQVQDLLEENRRLRERLEELRSHGESLPYEGVYWFDFGGSGEGPAAPPANAGEG